MSLDSLANYYRSQLKGRGAQACVLIEAAHAQAMQQMQPHLEQLYLQVQQQEDAPIPLTWLYEDKKLERLNQVVREHIGKFAYTAHKTIEQLIQWAFLLGKEAAQAFLAASSRPVSPIPSVASIQISSDLFDGFGVQATTGVSNAFVCAISLESTAHTLAREVVQRLNVSRWRSLTILDTELFKSFNVASFAVFLANTALIDGWIWHCQLSPKSCACCVALHGTIHPLSEVFQDHPNGSCIKIPYVVGMEAIQTGIEWFKQQDEGMQQTILGSRKAWELYRSGVSLQAFVGQHHDAKYGTSVYQKSVRELMR